MPEDTKKVAQKKPYTVREYFGLPHTEGEVGVEIEVEGTKLPEINSGGWRTDRDGSLRGLVSREYVFAKPVPRQEVGKTLQYFGDSLRKYKAEVDHNSTRTGVHVHLNMQDKTFKQVITTYCLYSCMEDLFVKFSGEHREGNLFCLRNKDAGFLVDYVKQTVKTQDWTRFGNDIIRYASINLCALPKYGSLEFRSMRGTVDPDLINTWVNMLLKVKDSSLQYNDPSDIPASLSAKGEQRFLIDNMGEYAELLQCSNMNKLLREGIRGIQEVAYAPFREKLNNGLPPPNPLLGGPEGQVRPLARAAAGWNIAPVDPFAPPPQPPRNIREVVGGWNEMYNFEYHRLINGHIDITRRQPDNAALNEYHSQATRAANREFERRELLAAEAEEMEEVEEEEQVEPDRWDEAEQFVPAPILIDPPPVQPDVQVVNMINNPNVGRVHIAGREWERNAEAQWRIIDDIGPAQVAAFRPRRDR